MKMPIRIIIAVFCAALILCMPFFLSSPRMLSEARETYLYSEDEDEGEDESMSFGRLLFGAALADEASAAEVSDEEDPFGAPAKLSVPAAWVLPWDFSVPPIPDPDGFTADGYEDESIRVRLEKKDTEAYCIHIVHVEIASPSQLRTTTAYGRFDRAMYMDKMAKSCNAVIAMNGDLFIEMPEKKKFEIRMTQTVGKREGTNKKKDTLIIDKNGDFHLFVRSDGLAEFRDNHRDEIANAFMFGPALVMDGEIVETESYDYNPKGHEPRSAIGQTGPLSYVLVVVEGKVADRGITIAELAEVMLEAGCTQAYALDGGNTAEMIMIGPDADRPQLHVKGRPNAEYRTHSDIIYFATAVPETDRK